MTRHEILRRWPHATEATIQRNLSTASPAAIERNRAFHRFNGGQPDTATDTASAPLGAEAEAPRALRGSQGAKKPVPAAPVTGDRVTRSWTVNCEPVSAPRMTRADSHPPRRPAVQRYFDYQNRLRSQIGEVAIVPDAVYCVFWVAMPESWSKKRKLREDGRPHRQRLDIDNLYKGILDSLIAQDGGVWRGSQEKRWCWSGKERVEITFVYDP